MGNGHSCTFFPNVSLGAVHQNMGYGNMLIASYFDNYSLDENVYQSFHNMTLLLILIVRKRRKQSNSEEENENDEAEEDSDEDDVEEEEEDEIEIEDVFISNFAFILVLLRAYFLEFVDHKYASNQPDSLSFEYLLIFLLCAWLYHSWHENGFNLMLDETSPFIAVWFMAIIILVMVLKVRMFRTHLRLPNQMFKDTDGVGGRSKG